MHGKFIQISTAVSAKGELMVYALDENGKIWEMLPGILKAKWVQLNN
ncbi:MAG: hypothetical protein ABWX90_03565 [Candidatus Saccharimonadales bacterium]